jgi:hypothetical protein
MCAVNIKNYMSEQTTSNIPSAARLSRIESILTAEPAFKGRIGKKTVAVVKRDGTKVHYSQEVVNVGIAIQSDGKDAVSISKREILDYAIKVINGGVGASSEAVAAEAPGASAPVVAESVPSESVPSESVPADGGTKINYAIPCMALIVGAKQLSELIADRDSGKVAKLTKLLSDAQALAGELQ